MHSKWTRLAKVRHNIFPSDAVDLVVHTLNFIVTVAMTGIHFHQNTFSSKPFASINHERDWLEQAQAPGTVLLQPELGRICAIIMNYI